MMMKNNKKHDFNNNFLINIKCVCVYVLFIFLFLNFNFNLKFNYITHPGILINVHVIPYFPALVVRLRDAGSCSRKKIFFF